MGMARFEINEHGEPQVVLSERNLLTLLSKLYTPHSQAQFMSGDVPEGSPPIRIKAERDGLHYASPTRDGAAAGQMHPVTEKILERIQEVIAEEELAI